VRDSEVDQVEFIHQAAFSQIIANHDVIRLDIAVDVPNGVQLLQEIDHRDADLDDALDREVTLVPLQDIFDA